MEKLLRAKNSFLRDWLLEVILVVLIIFFALFAPNFFTMGNVLNILRNISFKGIIALGMTMVIISGEIDLSVGSGVAFFGVICALSVKKLTELGVNDYVAVGCAIIIVLSLGYLFGIGVASIVTKFGVPSFIATLATMQLLRGAALLLSGGFPVIAYPTWFTFFGSGYVGPIPFPAIVFTVILLIMFYVLKNTPFGRSIYAVGSNKESAKLSGINVVKVKRRIFGITTVFVALAGMMISAQIFCGSPISGEAWEMDVIAAVIIGGASLKGGSGTIRGTLIGCIFLGVLLNGMTLLNVKDFWQYIMRGMLILGAVLLNIMVQDN